MRRRKLSIALPASVVSDVPHLREKTSKVGLIGRSAALFMVDEIIVYLDDLGVDQSADVGLLSALLGYMETPQYLRRRLFGLRPELRYAGVLPPLRTPHHPLNRRVKGLKVGEYREGVTLAAEKHGVLVDIGVEKPALVSRKLAVGRRVTVRITRIGDVVEAELAKRREVPEYWGYVVTAEELSLGEVLEARGFDLTVATSRRGVPFAEVAGALGERWRQAGTVLVAFGAPGWGLFEIAEKEGLDLKDVADFVVNTFPVQGAETVRTEEALVASLAVLSCSLALKA